MAESVHTTIATWVMPIMRALEPFCDGHELLTKAGIDPKCIEDANQRVPIEKMKRLWDLAEEATGDDCIGLEVIKYVSPTNFHALSYAHLASSSMRESLERAIKFSDVVSTAMKINMRDENDEVILSWHKVEGMPDNPSIHAIDAFMALMVTSGQQIAPDNKSHLISAKLTRGEPKDIRKHEQIYDCPIEFNADKCELRLKREFVDRSIPTGNIELARINEQVLAEYLARFRKNDVVGSVYSALIELMPLGEPTQDKVAKVLGTSSRSLHRKLKELDTSYKTILDDTRKHLAMQYIKQSDLSITSITYRLGFLDSSSFSRSFKRWTGLSPSEYRKQMS